MSQASRDPQPARNPMGQWLRCPLHGTPHRAEDNCPDCSLAHAATVKPTPRRRWLAAIWKALRNG